MKITHTTFGMLLLAAMATGCTQHEPPAAAGTTADAQKLNANAPASVTRPDTASEKVDPEEPKAGLNTERPDSSEDVIPEKR
jgi:hypothetical protein